MIRIMTERRLRRLIEEAMDEAFEVGLRHGRRNGVLAAALIVRGAGYPDDLADRIKALAKPHHCERKDDATS